MGEAPACRIRSAAASDLPELVGLLQDLFAIEVDFQPDPAKQESGLRQLLATPGGHIWVAEAGGCVVGMCTLQVLVSTAEGGPVGLVEDVVVAAARRGCGIGGMLLAAAERWSRANGLTRLQLLADRDNHPALEFYRRHGWDETRLVGLRKLPNGET